mmetsp:Transcript_25681/g.37682  ORF Transcript_25681/g.37682 Transcript_25681/m.37682 type:complete len:96 (-) Transcript_25681:4-291(-)
MVPAVIQRFCGSHQSERVISSSSRIMNSKASAFRITSNALSASTIMNILKMYRKHTYVLFITKSESNKCETKMLKQRKERRVNDKNIVLFYVTKS